MAISNDLIDVTNIVRKVYLDLVSDFPLHLNDTVVLKWELDGLKGHNLDLRMNLLAMMHALAYGQTHLGWQRSFAEYLPDLTHEGCVVIRSADLDSVGETFMELNANFSSAFPEIDYATLQRTMELLVELILDDIKGMITVHSMPDLQSRDVLMAEFSDKAHHQTLRHLAGSIAKSFINGMGVAVRSKVFLDDE